MKEQNIQSIPMTSLHTERLVKIIALMNKIGNHGDHVRILIPGGVAISHGLRTPNEGINQRYLKNWADVADKICCRHT